MVDRSEPSFMPGWLKGTGGTGMATQKFQDDSGISRMKAGMIRNSSDSTWNPAPSDKVFSPSIRRGAFEQQTLTEKDHLGNRSTHHNFHRSSSARTRDTERDASASWSIDQNNDHGHGSDNVKRKERILGVVAEEPDTRLLLSLDSERRLRRSQSQSPRFSEQQGVRKGTEMVPSLSSVNEGLSMSRHKTAFDRNFPSLGSDEKQNNFSLSSLNGHSLMGSPWPVGQGSLRGDLNRASSSGLMGGFPNSTVVSASMNLNGIDVWNSLLVEVPNPRGIDAQGPLLSEVPNSRGNDARSSLFAETSNSRANDGWTSSLTEVPISNGNTQGSSSPVSVSSGQPAASAGLVTIAATAPLNMAEALAQSSPRVQTTPQVSLESQRLEELALKQSRQLIPMMPSLPKAMVHADKSKAKASRSADGATMASKGCPQAGSTQSHKTLFTTRVEPPKHSQGKLLVLKSGRDGAIVAASSKVDLSNGSQLAPQGSTDSSTSSSSIATSSNVVVSSRKGSVPSVPAPDERRPSLQARNRSVFFNSIRKKSNNGVTSNISNESKSEITDETVGVPTDKEEKLPGDGSEWKLNGTSADLGLPLVASSSIHANGVSKRSFSLVPDNPLQKSFSDEIQEEMKAVSIPGASEEEEAAFMRSLGWEENAEGSELTEEEINAFYNELNERKNLINGTCKHKVMRALSTGRFMGSFESISSACLSSSDSEPDEEPPYHVQVASLSNTVH